jgi:hypothetical protein
MGMVTIGGEETGVRFGAGSVLAAGVALAVLAGQGHAQTFTKMPLDMPADAAPPPIASPPPPIVAPPEAPALPQHGAVTPLQGEAATLGSSTECGPLAGLYLAPGNLKIFVTRRGTMVQDNPLRPLTNDLFIILQIVVNNRMASAYGPDFDNLRRAGAPQTLEGMAGTKITWASRPEAMPRSLRVVAEDGAVVLSPIVFSACAEAPKVAAPPPVVKRPTKAPGPEAYKAPRPSIALPQGAIP